MTPARVSLSSTVSGGSRSSSRRESVADAQPAGGPAGGDWIIDIRGGASCCLPPLQPRTGTAGATLAALLKSGSGKLVGQTLSTGAGEIVGAGVRIGFNALIMQPGYGAIMAVVAGGAVVGVSGVLVGYRAAQLIRQGVGAGTPGAWTQGAFTLAPAVIPLLSALVTGLTQGSVAGAGLTLSEALARRVASGVRDSFNEFGRDALPDSKAVDSDGRDLDDRQTLAQRGLWSGVAPLPLNLGVAALGQFLLPLELDGATGYALAPEAWARASVGDEFRSGLGGIATSALVKGGFAGMLEVGRAVAALRKGGGLRIVPGRGLSAIRDNLRDTKQTWSKVADHASMRITMAAVSGDAMASLPRSTAVKIVTSALQAIGETRELAVKAGQLGREDKRQAPPQGTHPAPPPTDEAPLELQLLTGGTGGSPGIPGTGDELSAVVIHGAQGPAPALVRIAALPEAVTEAPRVDADEGSEQTAGRELETVPMLQERPPGDGSHDGSAVVVQEPDVTR